MAANHTCKTSKNRAPQRLGIRKKVIVNMPVRNVPVTAIVFAPNLLVSLPAAKLPMTKRVIMPMFCNTIKSVDIKNRWR